MNPSGSRTFPSGEVIFPTSPLFEIGEAVIGRSKRFPTKKAMRNGENEARGGYGTAFAYDDKHPRFTTEQSTEPSLSVYTNRKIAVHGFGAEDCSLVEVLEFNTRNEIGSLILNTTKLKELMSMTS
jgi:hypothetical protein